MNTENISYEQRDELAKNPIFKTILEPDDRYSEHRPTVIIYLSTGTKYIKGLVVHKDSETGKIQPNYWIAKFDKKTAKVFDGQRWDLIDQYNKFLAEKREHNNKRDKFYTSSWYDVERGAREHHNKIMTAWILENKPPINPFESN